jgi:hypothetical protein
MGRVRNMDEKLTHIQKRLKQCIEDETSRKEIYYKKYVDSFDEAESTLAYENYKASQGRIDGYCDALMLVNEADMVIRAI